MSETPEPTTLEKSSPDCAVCGSPTVVTGSVHSSFSNRTFALAHCSRCHYSFVVDPRTDYEALYDEEYYRGKGADPIVDYEQELDDPRTVRAYEWRAILEIVGHLRGGTAGVRWLDFGCGLGGFVRYGRSRGINIVGFDEGYAAERMRQDGTTALAPAELDAAKASFHMVTAIEVLEHVVDPMPTLRRVAELLRPGGLFFLTTGNAARFRHRLDQWRDGPLGGPLSFFSPPTPCLAFCIVWAQPTVPG